MTNLSDISIRKIFMRMQLEAKQELITQMIPLLEELDLFMGKLIKIADSYSVEEEMLLDFVKEELNLNAILECHDEEGE